MLKKFATAVLLGFFSEVFLSKIADHTHDLLRGPTIWYFVLNLLLAIGFLQALFILNRKTGEQDARAVSIAVLLGAVAAAVAIRFVAD